MGILSFLRFYFHAAIALTLRVWQYILQFLHSIRLRGRLCLRPRGKHSSGQTLPLYSTTVPSNPLSPSASPIRVPPAAVVPRKADDALSFEPTEPGMGASVATDSPSVTQGLRLGSRVYLGFRKRSVPGPDIECGNTAANVYPLSTIDTPTGDQTDLPCLQPSSPRKSISLLQKATRLLKKEPFTNTASSCLDGQITNRSAHALECGGYSDIYQGTLHGHIVAVKVIRSFTSSSRKRLARVKLQKRVWREYLTWSSLSYPNILPCLGFTFDFAFDAPHQLPALVSPWMSNGTVLEYLHNNPSASRLTLLAGITNGLRYLHTRSKPVIHGDLRCSNILVSANGQPCLTDFGLSHILNDTLGLTTSSNVGGSLRWMSPETLDGDKVTKASDVWAYGMTILELVTQKRPYAYLSSEPAVIRHVMSRILPSRPEADSAPDLNDDLWQLCLSCWEVEPKARCTMDQALHALSLTISNMG